VSIAVGIREAAKKVPPQMARPLRLSGGTFFTTLLTIVMVLYV